jgi:predicted acylesterase/phospholipase RssA
MKGKADSREEFPIKDNFNPRIGLALGSGAARGWAHIGVIRALSKTG